MLEGAEDLLIHGPGGHGKSFLINRLRKEAVKILFTAPSGIAAMNIRGVTIHSLFCLKPVIPQPQKYDNPLLKNRISLLEGCRALLIDEISMVSCDLLDKIDMILRTVRNNDSPFGGMRIIMVGDILQLQPFVPDKKSLSLMRKLYPEQDDFAFYHSKVFKDLIIKDDLKIYNLTYDFRHENDPVFYHILTSIRTNKISEEGLKIINTRVINSPDNCIHLATTKQIANFLNDKEMDVLPDKADISELKLEIYCPDEHIKGSMYPMQDELSIKTGMKIMFVMNDSSFKGNRWVNGTRGKVIGKKYSNNELEAVDVSIETKTGNKYHTVTKERYDIYIPTYNKGQGKIDSLKIASVYQFPFIAAWAITIHRSQSLTIDSDIMLELGAKVFAEGQLYVGLSRVRNRGNLFLNRPITKNDILVSPKKYCFDLLLQSRSRLVVKEIDPMQEYKENMEIYMPYSYELSEEEENDIRRQNGDIYREKPSYNIQNHEIFSMPIESAKENITAESSLNGRIYKTKRAPEGLDKIKIILNPYYINLENKTEKLCAHNELTLHKGGPFRMVSIHAEFINHKQDIHISFARAVYCLIEKGIYGIDFLRDIDKDKAIYFIFKFLKHFIILISEVEFYFNIRQENIFIKKESIV
jgi:hypothetical protein